MPFHTPSERVKRGLQRGAGGKITNVNRQSTVNAAKRPVQTLKRIKER